MLFYKRIKMKISEKQNEDIVINDSYSYIKKYINIL